MLVMHFSCLETTFQFLVISSFSSPWLRCENCCRHVAVMVSDNVEMTRTNWTTAEINNKMSCLFAEGDPRYRCAEAHGV